jgi:hypothetical protein
MRAHRYSLHFQGSLSLHEFLDRTNIRDVRTFKTAAFPGGEAASAWATQFKVAPHSHYSRSYESTFGSTEAEYSRGSV